LCGLWFHSFVRAIFNLFLIVDVIYLHFSNEEDPKYIVFLTQVTDDIVQRGVYTNKGLKQLFHAHMEKHKHELDVVSYAFDFSFYKVTDLNS